jgi:glutaredoxin
MIMRLLLKFAAGVLLLAGAAAGAAAADIYKWKDAKGVLQFSDKPPPPSVLHVEVKSYAGGPQTNGLPFELAEAVRNTPVTLYTTMPCGPCDQGRALLHSRGIPYAEKTVGKTKADQAALQQAANTDQMPVLLVGPSPHVGFEAGAWNAALNAAAYPAKSLLPANYVQGSPSPAAAPQPAALATPAQAEPVRPEKLPTIKSPSDFQF